MFLVRIMGIRIYAEQDIICWACLQFYSMGLPSESILIHKRNCIRLYIIRCRKKDNEIYKIKSFIINSPSITYLWEGLFPLLLWVPALHVLIQSPLKTFENLHTSYWIFLVRITFYILKINNKTCTFFIKLQLNIFHLNYSCFNIVFREKNYLQVIHRLI